MTELFLPVKLAEDIKAAREAELALHMRADPVMMVQPGHPVSQLGLQPSKQRLLREIKGWAAIAARPISDRIMDLPWEVVRKRVIRGEVITESTPQNPLQFLIDNPAGLKPGGLFTKQLLLKVVVYHLLFTGEAYIQKVTNGFDATRELWPLPSDRTRPVYGEDGRLHGVEVTSASGGVVPLPAAEIIRIWCPDPLTMVTSMGALGPQAMEWNTQRALLGVEQAHFESGATPSVALKADFGTAPPNDDPDSFAEYWAQRYNARIGQYRGIPAFIPPGYDVVEFSQNKNIGDLAPIDERLSRQILAAYGVPGSIVGEDKEVNRATAEANQFVFDTHTISPMTSLIAGAMTNDLARDFGMDLAIRFEPFVAPDKEFELRREAQDIATFVRSTNQVREDRGWDETEWGDEPVAGVGQVPYRPDDAFEAMLGFEEVPRGGSERGSAPRPRGLRTRNDGEAIFARQMAAEKRASRRYARTVRGIFESQRRETLRRYRVATTDRNEREQRVTLDEIFDPGSWLPMFLRRLYPQRLEEFSSEAEATLMDLSGESFSTTSAAQAAMEARSTIDANIVNDNTGKRIQAILQKGIDLGKDAESVARQLSAIFRDRARARMIARTEIGAAFTAGQLAGAATSGVVLTKTWNTSLDERVRDTHVEVGSGESATRTLSERFNVGGHAAEGPRDPALPIGERANCRCFLTFGTDDDTEAE